MVRKLAVAAATAGRLHSIVERGGSTGRLAVAVGERRTVPWPYSSAGG